MMGNYNLWAILVATVASQVIGAAWYSPRLLGKAWMQEVGLTEEQIRANPTKRPFVVAILSALVLAAGLAWVNKVAGTHSLGYGIVVGLSVGIGVVAMAAAPHYAFSGRSLRLYLIDQAHTVLAIVVMSAIIGVWR